MVCINNASIVIMKAIQDININKEMSFLFQNYQNHGRFPVIYYIKMDR